MKYNVVIKGTFTPSDEVDADVDTLADAINDEFDNTDIDIYIEDDDGDGQDISYAFSVADVELTEVKEA
jgi:hypothetical protein